MGVIKEKKVFKKSDVKHPSLRPIIITKQVTVKMDYVKRVNNLVLEGNCADNWKRFKQSYDIFEIAAEIKSKPEEVRIATFLNTIGNEALEVFNSFDLSTNERNSYDSIINAFEVFCKTRVNETYERFKFFKRKQRENEPFNDFLMDIRKLAKSCGFVNLESSLLKDQIVSGIFSDQTRKELLKTTDLNYGKAVEMCRSTETSSIQVKDMHQENSTRSLPSTSTNTTVDYIKGNPNREMNFNHNRNYNENRNFNNNNFYNPSQRTQMGGKQFLVNRGNKTISNHNIFICRYCNQKHAPRSCPAFGQKCSNCFKYNHFAVMCNSRNTRSINTINENNFENVDELFVYSINSYKNYKNTFKNFNHSSKQSIWKEKIRINNSFIEFKLDSGSGANIIPFKLLQKVDRAVKIEPTSMVLSAYGGQQLHPKGICQLICMFKNEIRLEEFIIIDEDLVPILGLKSCVDLNLIKKVNEIELETLPILDDKERCMNEYVEQFKGLGKFVKKHKIDLKEDSEQYAVVKPPRRVPLKIRENLKTTLNQLVKLKIIEKVDEPRMWVHNMVIVEKLNGDLRICLDPKNLNKCIKQNKYLIPTVEDISMKLYGAKIFSVLDLKDGFWHVELDEESKKLVTFATPFGNYQFNRLPFGLCSSAETFQKYNEENFGDIEGVAIYIDDILIAGKTMEDHDRILKQVLERAKKLNVKFNPHKFQYKVPSVTYLGFKFTEDGRQIDENRIRTIKELKNPKDKKDLQKFLGVVNYLRSFLPNLSEVTSPLRELLKKNVLFQWNQTHSDAVTKIKELIVEAPILQNFNPDEEIIIQTDASQNGLGCCLLQKQGMVSCGSRSLSETEKMYAQIEKEFLAVVFSTVKFRDYIYGRSVLVQSDHKPLVSIMQKDIHKIPSSKLQRMRLRLLNYDIKLEYIPGKYLHLADYLSRYFLDSNICEEEKVFTESVLSINVSEEKVRLFQKETIADSTLKVLLKYAQEGWPNDRSKVIEQAKFYFKMRNDILVENGIVYFNDRIVVPMSLRKEMIKILHESHQGISKTKKRAQEIFYWPGLNSEIEECITKCDKCQTIRNSATKEKMIPHEIPELPFNKVSCDILEYQNKNYLVLIDYYSKWIELRKIKNKSSSEIIFHWMEMFSIYGVPKILIADNVPFNSFECHEFAKNWNFEITTTSPLYAQSNGLAERAVGIVKNILKKSETTEELLIGLMEYRNTPTKDMNYSPAQLLQNRRLRTKIPVVENFLRPSINQGVRECFLKKSFNNQKYYNRGKINKNEFQTGEKIRIRKDNFWVPGTIVKKWHTPRSYIVRDKNNNEYRRNSSFLKTDASNLNSAPTQDKIVTRQHRSGNQYNSYY